MRTKQTLLSLILFLAVSLSLGFLSTCLANQFDIEETGNDTPIIISSTGEIPKVLPSLRPLNLTRPPSREEIMAAGQFGGQLYPTHEITDQMREGEINLSFGHAMQAWNRHEYTKAVRLLKKHVEEYPDSPWASEAILHLGCDSQYNGRYTEAEQHFNWLILENTNKTQAGARTLLNKARLRMGVLKVYQFNFEEAKELFRVLKQESEDWRDRTYASHWIQRLSAYSASEQALLNCGTQALAYILENDCREKEAIEVLGLAPENVQGQSIKALSDIASLYGYRAAALKTTVSELNKMPLPAIMHVQDKNAFTGHYWILEKVAGTKVSLFDPQSLTRYEQSLAEFSREWTGNALVFSDTAVLPGKQLAENEIGQIYGGCCGVPRPEDNLGNPGPHAASSKSGGWCPFGSPQWLVNMVRMNLYVNDIPLWYRSSIGPSVAISLSYNSESAIAYNEPFGNKWQLNYGTYLVVDTGGNVTIFMPDGRRDVYSPNGSVGYNNPVMVYNTLTKIANNHFELKFPDDTLYVYNIPPNTNSQQPLLVSIQDPHGQTLSFAYTTVNSTIRLTTITDALSRVTTLTYNNDGLVTQVTDPFNRHASFAYDVNRNLVSIADMGNFESTLSYDEDAYLTNIENGRGQWGFYIEPADGISNNLSVYPPPGAAMWENYRITITNPVGDKEEYYYNGSTGQESFYVSPQRYTDYVDGYTNNYSNLNKTVFKLNWTTGQGTMIKNVVYPGGTSYSFDYWGGGDLAGIIDAYGNRTSINYNNGKITSIQDPLNNISQFAYDSNTDKLTSVTDAAGNAYNYEYDESGNLSKIKYPDYPLNGEITLTHNYYGAITCLTDTRGKAYKFEYGTTGNLTTVTNPINNEDSYTYDSIGRAVSHTDPNGNTLAYVYDNLNRITSVTYPGPSVKSFTYNCCRLGSVSYQNTTASFTYGANGRVASYTDVYGKTISYAYDKNGNLTTLTYPGNKVVTYGYDLTDRLISVTDWLDNTVTYEYDLAGNLTKTGYPDGSTLRNKYDNAARLTAIADYKADGTINAVFNYTLNALGNRTDTSFTQPQNSVPSPSSIANTHADDNGLLTSGSATYEYDNNGNVITRTIGSEVTSYTWDYDNMLTQITSGCNTLASYTYDVLGNRVAFGNTRYVVDPTGGLSKVLAETDASGNITAYYVYGLGLLSKITPADQAYYYHYDGIGSTIAITNASGTVVNKYAYDEYGKVLSQTEATSNPFKYVGKYGVMDDGIGLLYMRARYYDYEMRRFISKDPIGFGGGLNVYSYVGNNPINGIDPLGLWSVIFEGYLPLQLGGWGGGFIFGENPNGRGFVSFRGGRGVGGNIALDTNGTSTGWNPCDPSGLGLGVYGNAGYGLLTYNAGISAGAGINLMNGNIYSGSNGPSSGLYKIGFSAGAGIEIIIW